MNVARIISILIDLHVYLQPIKEEEKSRLDIPFEETVGSLMFLTIISRLDIAFAKNTINRYLSNHEQKPLESCTADYQIFKKGIYYI